MPKITIVLEYKETGGGEIWPVEGRSGTVYGYATRCPKRGSFCHRMPLEQFQRCREDIFSGRKISYPPVPDVEIEEEAVVVLPPAPPAPAPVAPAPQVEPVVEPDIEEISNAEAAAIDEDPPEAPAVEVPAPVKPAPRPAVKPKAKKPVKPGKKRS